MQEVKSLWHRAFGDTKRYMDYYFAQKAPASRLYTDYEGVELASMMFFTPYEICFRGKLMTAEYIVGVATEEKYRRQSPVLIQTGAHGASDEAGDRNGT